MKPREVESALERKVSFELQSDGAVPLAVNRGNPLVLSDPRADFSRGVSEMAKALLTPRGGQTERKRMFTLGRS